MKTNPNHPISQCRHQDGSVMTLSSFKKDDDANEYYVLGLSKREHFAAMAMQGLLASCDWNNHVLATDHINSTGDFSVQLADALISALNKEEQ